MLCELTRSQCLAPRDLLLDAVDAEEATSVLTDRPNIAERNQ